MGWAKQRQLELNSKGLSSIIDTQLCSSHIDDYAIRRFINSNGAKGHCDYCEKTKKIVPLEILMIFIMEGIMSFYEDAAEFMSYDSREGGYLGDTYSSNELINDLVGLEIDNSQLKIDIINCIEEKAWSEPNKYYDNERDVLFYHWNYFKDVVKHKSRYLFARTSKFKTLEYKQDAYNILREIGNRVKTFKLLRNMPKETNLFRCRQHTGIEKIRNADQMTSPPQENAIYSNRMSPAGISMFYGAFDLETAKLETIDPKKKTHNHYTSSIFVTKNNLNVIDFSKLPTTPSIFDKKNLKNYYFIKFLRDFVRDLSSDISHDGKEHIEYVPTQIVTEFFRFIFSENKKIRIDGIVYPSSKNIGRNACVLFLNNEESLNELDFVTSSLITKKITLKT